MECQMVYPSRCFTLHSCLTVQMNRKCAHMEGESMDRIYRRNHSFYFQLCMEIVYNRIAHGRRSENYGNVEN